MSEEQKPITIASLPAPDANAPGTMSAEELAKILARARAETAEKVVTVGEEQRKREERDAAEREARQRWECEQREVRVIDADTAARRGQANMTLARSACITSGATLAGFLVAGPVGAVVGAGVGWVANHLFGGE